MITTLDITTKNLEKYLGHLGRVFNKASWNFTDLYLWANLNFMYNREGYYFDWSSEQTSTTLYRYIHSAGYTTMGKQGSSILVYINPGSAQFFRRFAKPNRRHLFYEIQRNAFFRELFLVISHEHVHEFQLINRNYIDTTDYDGEDYYGDSLEQSAFAQQAAVEIIHTGKSQIVASYEVTFGKDSKVFKKWYSRVIRYMMNFKRGEVEFLTPIDTAETD